MVQRRSFFTWWRAGRVKENGIPIGRGILRFVLEDRQLANFPCTCVQQVRGISELLKVMGWKLPSDKQARTESDNASPRNQHHE
jgi:hypothetical protein